MIKQRSFIVGEQFEQSQVNKSNIKEFERRVSSQLEQLKETVKQPSFDLPKYSFGAELEMYLVDRDTGLPSPSNAQLLASVNDQQLQPELNQFNIEFNSQPVDCSPDALNQLEQEFRQKLDVIQTHASGLGLDIASIGILPTLSEQHLDISNMTDIPRYHTLAHSLLAMRNGKPFEVNINGQESLKINSHDVTMEGACTSFQVHLRLPVSEFSNTFNAAQLTAPLVLALSANSPILAQKKLWHETRIPLFKQSIDCRLKGQCDWRQPSRVTFGHGYLRQYPWEQFAEHVALFDPLFPVLFDEETSQNVPKFKELCLHHGTVWAWNRSVYSHLDDGHMRIEFRSIPSGPTVDDMMANMAIAIGWAVGLADDIDDYLYQVPFRFCEYNFYRCAEHSLDAGILWPETTSKRSVETPVSTVIESLLPVAVKGLKKLGIDSATIEKTTTNIQNRLHKKQNGAIWQLNKLTELEQTLDRQAALQKLVQTYIRQSHSGKPVADWD
jgi:gamma-glutamyl:cysteine ligase YbdK (ATP-grasp superfamily)